MKATAVARTRRVHGVIGVDAKLLDINGVGAVEEKRGAGQEQFERSEQASSLDLDVGSGHLAEELVRATHRVSRGVRPPQ